MKGETKKVRILLLDDHALLRDALARILSAEPDFEIVGSCASMEDARAVATSTPIDLVLLDLDLGEERGSEFLRLASEFSFQGKVLIVTAGLTDLEAAQLISQGAAGVFFKHNPPSSLSMSIRAVMSGQAWVDQRYLRALQALSEEEQRRPRFSERERAVLNGVLKGLANKEIADQLRISESSVKVALQQLFDKTGVRTRSQLVRVALEEHRDQLQPDRLQLKRPALS